MTYQTYKKTLIIIGMLYLPWLLLDVLGKYFMPNGGASLLAAVTFFAFRIPSLVLLFFSIYAAASGVTGTGKIEDPAIFIVLGAILVIS